MKCSTCGNEVDSSASTCPYCGYSITNKGAGQPQRRYSFQTPTVEDKVNGLLVALAIFFPIVGVIVGVANLKTRPHSAKVYIMCSICAWVISYIIINAL